MARVGLWAELVHHLGTLDVPPIPSLRFIRPIAINRYHNLDIYRYTEYWDGVRHGKRVEIPSSRSICFEIYNLGEQLCIYGYRIMQTSGFQLILSIHGSILKWKKDLVTNYYGDGPKMDKMRVRKLVRSRCVCEVVVPIDWDRDIYYIASDLIKMMESM